MKKKIILGSMLAIVLLGSLALGARQMVEFYVTKEAVIKIAENMIRQCGRFGEIKPDEKLEKSILDFHDLNYDCRDAVFQAFREKNNVNVWATGLNLMITKTVLDELADPAKLRSFYQGNVSLFLDQMENSGKELLSPGQIKDALLAWSESAKIFFHYLNFAVTLDSEKKKEFIAQVNQLSVASQKAEELREVYWLTADSFQLKWKRNNEELIIQKGVAEEYWSEQQSLILAEIESEKAHEKKDELAGNLIYYIQNGNFVEIPFGTVSSKVYTVQWVERRRVGEGEEFLAELKKCSLDLSDRLRERANKY